MGNVIPRTMRRVTGAVLAIMALLACDGDATWPFVRAPLATLDGVWLREEPNPGPSVDPAPPQWLRLDRGRYLLASGNFANPVGAFALGQPGRFEAGRVRESADGLEWTVDSIVTIGGGIAGGAPTRRVERDVLYIEGHPFSGATARVAGDVLLLHGTNPSSGMMGPFSARFRRSGPLPDTGLRRSDDP
jgi:hypothetical protein